ncbi:MAG: hypothetical protein C4584_02770 [Armatimonadetes bacterium]|nr:MAG: hypothetical protein C4584_02770 [Armatimonadota bacterium]
MKLKLTKRNKIIIVSILLSLGLLSTQLVPFYLTQRFILGLAFLAYFLSLWALWEGLNILKAFILIILPTLFTLSVASYYFLLPVRWLTRLPVAVIFGLTFYTLLLSQNVFNVASIRTIPLYRVAFTAVFVLTLLTAYLLFNVVFAFNLLFIWNGVVIFLLSLPLILQVIWSIEMEGISSLTIVYSLALALIIGEVGLVLSFWPISGAMSSLILSTVMYIILGISTHALKERLSRVEVWEYAGWGIAIMMVATLTTSWMG